MVSGYRCSLLLLLFREFPGGVAFRESATGKVKK